MTPLRRAKNDRWEVPPNEDLEVAIGRSPLELVRYKMRKSLIAGECTLPCLATDLPFGRFGLVF